MPRVQYLRDRDEELREYIFGTTRHINVKQMAEAIGISATTVYSWKERPTRINLTALEKIGRYLKWGTKDYITVMEIIKGG
ncbi:MAG: helix-turn-helix transcriptional regulator [Oscillospiraceae bacterium]|nr:helix-turn-helix transcriptional regulator [Oscillospiraceae bacterium]